MSMTNQGENMEEVLSGRVSATPAPVVGTTMATLLATLLATALVGCSGGGGDAGLLAGQSDGSSMTCPDAGMQCSGNTILRTDNGIGVTASGLQTYAISTNDLMPSNPSPGSAWGLQPATGGIADVRVNRDASGQTTGVTLLLSKLGGVATFSALPPPTDLNFYDYAKKGAAATQSHYANNIYFPRSEPVRCPSTKPDCPTIETDGIHTSAGDWRNGGLGPDNVWASRLHEDGATQAGYGQDNNGNLVLLPAADGIGVSYPGFKGFRDYRQWSYASANLAAGSRRTRCASMNGAMAMSTTRCGAASSPLVPSPNRR
jgi:hypothetical protein